ncbi:MAG: restriction endonuclease subunit S [Bacteroidaceae bacterium]|nr:restriction endonuclease subunit S [Bacteroidaceae bacterium]
MSKAEYKRLGDYIREVNVRNRELKVTNLLGVSISKEFMPSIANTIGTDMSTYKIVERGQFAYGPVTSRNGDKVSIALLGGYDDAIISQAYTVFEVIDHEQLLPEYLMMWFRRPEFDRYARFHSHGSAREIFDWNELCDVMLPIPSITRQREIVSEYETLTNRIRLNNQMIQYLEATAQALYRKTFVENIDKENLPEGWRMGTLGDICKCISGYPFDGDLAHERRW